jgi:putative membrane protein
MANPDSESDLPGAQPTTGTPPPLTRSFVGGVLMGLANLVPGISGGTMILAIGLYDRFIGAVADVTRLRLKRDTILFLGFLGTGLVAAILSLSGVAVGLVNDHRWIMYSLFIGLTLGGVPELLRLARPIGPGVIAAVLGGIALMATLAWGLSDTQLPQSMPVLVVVGAVAASSMILPGVSGSYVLLILGMYDLVIGSLSASAIKEDVAGSASIFGPVVVGAVIGIALLSNVLKWVLGRFPSVSHGVLLGLLCGSVLGLWPFQEAGYPDLAEKRLRKATVMLLAGEEHDAVRAKHGDDLDDARLEALAATYTGKSPGELKRLSMELEFFRPGGLHIGASLGLLLVGFFLTRALGGGERKKVPSEQG